MDSFFLHHKLNADQAFCQRVGFFILSARDPGVRRRSPMPSGVLAEQGQFRFIKPGIAAGAQVERAFQPGRAVLPG